MKADLYTKAVLTVIAVALSVIACNQYINPKTTARAQGTFTGVQFSSSEPVSFHLFDSRTGDVWYYSPDGTGGNGMRKDHFKVSAPGGPATIVR